MSTEDLELYAEDAKLGGKEADNILARLSLKADEYVEALREVEQARAALDRAERRARMIREEELPALMDEAKQTDVRTSSGLRVTLKEVIRASIPEARRAEALSWLESRGHASVIKHVLTAEFGRGEGERAVQAAQALMSINVIPSEKRSVHPQTLAALIRELLEQGSDVPLELFGVHRQREAVVK